jgi:hypothetical protein
MDGVSSHAATDLQRPSLGQVPGPTYRPVNDTSALLTELLALGARPEPGIDVILRIALGESLPASLGISVNHPAPPIGFLLARVRVGHEIAEALRDSTDLPNWTAAAHGPLCTAPMSRFRRRWTGMMTGPHCCLAAECPAPDPHRKGSGDPDSSVSQSWAVQRTT